MRITLLVLPTLLIACGAPPPEVAPEPSIATAARPTAAAAPAVELAGDARRTRTPIKHVVVVIGENRTFDHVFATYRPRHGQRIWNLLSRGIVDADGSPGPRFADAVQRQASDEQPDGWLLHPRHERAYERLPPPLAGGPTKPYFSTLAQAAAAESALAPEYLRLLTTGGTNLPPRVADTRIANVFGLPPGPFPLTPGVKYDDYAASPVHRFYQMWQQLDCDLAQSSDVNPSGCKSDLFPWVEVSVGAGGNGKPRPTPFSDATTGEGATAMGFYNVLRGDAPYLTYLADHFAMSDNFHQAVQGGTGANHVMLGSGDAIWYSDGKGHPIKPPPQEVENPDPQPDTNNWYTQDGYSGGTYSNCSDSNQPGVDQIVDYLNYMGIDSNCRKNHYYLLNNYAPGYFGDGSVNPDPLAIPPSTLRTIGDELSQVELSWRYYGDQWNRYLRDPNYQDPLNNYCDICNPFQYSTAIMTNPQARGEHLKDTIDFYDDIARGWLPAVSFVKPSGLVDGHPASSKLDLFEGFTKKIVDAIAANPSLWQETAIFVTFDEGGGYWDSGYVQPLDFFGDGTRIPMIVVSPWTRGGYVSHDYSDHVSILKFIEANWRLPTVTARSRDNLPNPHAEPRNPWVPLEGAAIGDLMDFFFR